MACVAPAHPSQKEDEEDLAAFELPFFQRLVVQLWAMVLGLITRLTDAMLLVGRPALVRPYVGLWLAERLRSSYRARRSFEVVLALRAPSSGTSPLTPSRTPSRDTFPDTFPAGEPLPQAGAEEGNEAPQAEASKEPLKERTPRLDWADLLSRTFDLDVFACVRCGGRRRVLAYVTAPGGVGAMVEHLGLPTASAHLAPARGPPRAGGVEAQAAPAKRARPLPRTSWEGGLGRRVPQGAARLVHPPGALLGRPPSAALLGPCAPALTLHRASLPLIRFAWPRIVRAPTPGPTSHLPPCGGARTDAVL
jgi:hypothetical protein